MKKHILSDERMMVKVADLYYNQNLSQQEIAEKLSISRPSISKLLQAARAHGIVSIHIQDPHGRTHFRLEQELEERFQLKEVVIVDSASTDEETKTAMAKAAAQYLSDHLVDGEIVGVAMGSTIAKIAEHIPEGLQRKVTFVPMIGGIGIVRNELHSNAIAEALATCFHGQVYPLHVPAMLSRKSTKEALLKEHSIQQVFKKAARMHTAVVGIGAPIEGSTIYQTGYFTDAMIQEIRDAHMCGDICMTYFDDSGNIDRFPYNAHIMAVDLHMLRKVEQSIGVSGGKEKIAAVLGALHGGFINILITDLVCAQGLLEAVKE